MKAAENLTSPPGWREYFEALSSSGRARALRDLGDAEFIVRHKLNPQDAREMITACVLCELADIESRLIENPMQGAKLVSRFIAKIARPGQVSKKRRQ